MKGGRSTGTMRGTRSGSKAPDGARRTASGGRTGKKKRGSGGIIWLLVALLLFAAVTVAFVVALSDRGVDGPEGDTPAERGPTRLSDRLDIEEWPSSDPTVAASVVRFNGLGATSVADLADAERMGRMSGLATELDTACGGGSFEGCEALARVVFASYLGCRQASACSGDEARSLFRRSIEASDSAIVLLRQLDGGSQGLALKRMTVHAVRLAGQGMPLLRADSPQLASLAEQACAGALGTTPDCTDALKK